MEQLRLLLNKALHSRGLPWSLAAAVLLGTLVYELLRAIWDGALLRYGQLLVLVLALVLAFLFVFRIIDLMEQRRTLERRSDELQAEVHDAYHRLEAILRVSQRFTEANDENEIIQPVLNALVDLTGAQGAAFVPLDEHGQPQTALSHGELPFPVQEAWLVYLTTPGVRDRCRNCSQREPVERPNDCPLLSGPFTHTPGLMCFSVRRGEREFGVMNLFLDQHHPLDGRVRIFVQTLLDETALGLEGIYLRRRELAALRQMQGLRQKADLTGMLDSLLESVYRTLEADFAMLVAPRSSTFQARIEAIQGELPPQARPFLDGLLQAVIASNEPVLLSDMAGDPAGDPAHLAIKSLAAAPLRSPKGSVIGAVLAGNRRARGLQSRQLVLLQTFASQAALVVQNAELMAELEYKTMIQERARLAREIHDGLAQTIGLLKLQGAQLRGYLQRGEFERASQNIEQFYTALAEAYQDARQAIDDLRISPDEDGLPGWLAQITREFQELTGLNVILDPGQAPSDLSPEVQAQLIRIVQEALSNVRKHAHAQQVAIVCSRHEGDLLLEVRDDGVGFAPEDVTGPSRYGLHSMRERAELIGADFQVISRPGEGAAVRVRLPLKREVQGI